LNPANRVESLLLTGAHNDSAYIARPSKELDTVIQFDITMLRNSAWKFMVTEFPLKKLKQLTSNGQSLADPKNKAWAVSHLEVSSRRRYQPNCD
jgi:hypothetical protein